MDQKCDRLYPSAPLEKKSDLKQRLEKKLNVVNSFNNHINNIKETINYFTDKNNKSKKKNRIYKTLNTYLESDDAIVIIAATSTSITLSITGLSLIILPKLAGIASALSLGIKVLHNLNINEYNKYKKQYKKDQQNSLIFR